MTNYGPPGQSFGKSGVLWLLANQDTPATAQELAKQAPVDATTVRVTLLSLFRKELVVRRKREQEGFRADPYEYAIRPRQEGADDRE